MKKHSTKVILILVIISLFYSCTLTKRVPEGRYLLQKAEVVKNGKKESSESIINLLYQKPNGKVAGVPLRLMVYNMAKVNGDSTYQAWLQRNSNVEKRLNSILSYKQTQRLGKSFLVSGFSEMLKKLGEAPVVYDDYKTRRTDLRLKNYFFNKGYFQTKVKTTVDTSIKKRAEVKYEIETGKPFLLDSIQGIVASSDLKGLYERSRNFSLLKTGAQYDADVLDKERDRITSFFRNNGAYDFQKTYINYEVDTLEYPFKAKLAVKIDDKKIKSGDTIITEPFKLYDINKVRYYVSHDPSKLKQLKDSVVYRNIVIYSDGKLDYKPKTITDANFIEAKTKFSDFTRTRTSRALGNLKVFNYPVIEYVNTPNDTTGRLLDVNVLLIPKKKFVFSPSIDVSHSNIQQMGIEGGLGLTFRNVFKGAELLDINVRGNIGSSASKYRSDQNNFFDILEYGSNVKLTFPRFLFLFKPDRIIPRRMLPTTAFSLGFSSQKNIGLDKQNLSSTFNYSWTPSRTHNFSFDLLNLQFVRNLNPDNYFNVYRSSYNTLNQIAQNSNAGTEYFDENGNLSIANSGADQFIEDALSSSSTIDLTSSELQTIRNIAQRKERLTENNLVLSASLVYNHSTRFNLNDNEFYSIRTKVESAGNVMSLISKINNTTREDGTRTFLDVAYSQYIKAEVDYVKYFDLGNKKVFALRAFGGIAIPYGNSNSIPFSRSYFAGGTNDNRAWQSYRLGPGSSGGTNDYNEANMKLAFSGEFRFNVTGPWNLGVFVDAGNIWNVLDNTIDETMIFTGWKSLKDLAVGSGVGVRYDFNFFLVRLDVGFKTYNPGKEVNQRWFRELNLSKAVFNIGINYPF